MGLFRGDVTNATLFDTNADPKLTRLMLTPPFSRDYWAGIEEGMNGFFDATPGTALDRLIGERYDAFVRNGVSATSPYAPSGDSGLSIPAWVAGRRAFIAPQLAAVQTNFTVLNAGGSPTTNAVITLTGTAPPRAQQFFVNGREISPTWPGMNAFTVDFLIAPGINNLLVRALDANGVEVGSTNLIVEFTGPYPWPALRISEWMADNTGFIRDPADNDAEDWFEIYNPSAAEVNLAGWFLSDTTNLPFRVTVPAGCVVPANGFLLVWADGEPGQNSTNRADLHVNFSLAKGGEAIALSAPDGTLVDSVSFGAQVSNVSQGRAPDGGTTIIAMPTPSPRGTNPYPAPTPLPLISVTGTNVTIQFTTIPRRSYRVEYKDSLDAASWTDLAPAQAADSSSMSIPDLADKAQRFYRVSLLP
jgi:hypothetical protein